jgi:tetratricopeptide (TPR) repeat protein
LLDRLVALEPNWAEAWNQRATVRFLAEDFDGSMADIDKVLKLEPRHFGALTGMGVILQREGLDKRALEVFNRALEIYPAQSDLKDSVDKLTLDVNGRDI